MNIEREIFDRLTDDLYEKIVAKLDVDAIAANVAAELATISVPGMKKKLQQQIVAQCTHATEAMADEILEAIQEEIDYDNIVKTLGKDISNHIKSRVGFSSL